MGFYKTKNKYNLHVKNKQNAFYYANQPTRANNQEITHRNSTKNKTKKKREKNL